MMLSALYVESIYCLTSNTDVAYVLSVINQSLVLDMSSIGTELHLHVGVTYSLLRCN